MNLLVTAREMEYVKNLPHVVVYPEDSKVVNLCPYLDASSLPGSLYRTRRESYVGELTGDAYGSWILTTILSAERWFYD